MYVGPSTLLDYIHGHIVTLIRSRPVCPKNYKEIVSYSHMMQQIVLCPLTLSHIIL